MSQLSRCKLTRIRKTVEETVWRDVLTTIWRSDVLTVPPLVGCCRWNLDYCSQLWSPHLIRHIIQIEKVQCSFTKCITGMCDCFYSDILSLLRLYSLQRRRERYCIIYVWKIIEDLVKKISKPIVCTHSDRRGRYCVVSHVNIGRSGTLAYNSFRWRAMRLFNSLPKFIRCTTSCSVYGFKHTLDSYNQFLQ